MKCIRFVLASTVLTVLPLLVLPPVSPAHAEVTELGWPYPQFNIEAYSSRQPSVCDPTNKPGPVRLKNLLSFWFGPPNQFNPNWHIGRPCYVSSTSYHREGRALDYYVNASEPRAQSIVDWMLATDEYGNPHSKARRWGIIEIIWKNSIWSSDRASEGFRPCPSCGPHFDHIHFSFSRPGASKQTSWHTTIPRVAHVACGGGTVAVRYWNYPSGFGPLRQVYAITGPLGNFTSQASLASSPWQVYSDLGSDTHAANAPVSALFGAIVFRGSCGVALF